MLRDVRLPLQCEWDLPYFGIELSVEWYFRIDISGQPIGPVFKGQAVQKLGTAGHFKMEPIVVPKRRYRTTILRCVKIPK